MEVCLTALWGFEFLGQELSCTPGGNAPGFKDVWCTWITVLISLSAILRLSSGLDSYPFLIENCMPGT